MRWGRIIVTMIAVMLTLPGIRAEAGEIQVKLDDGAHTGEITLCPVARKSGNDYVLLDEFGGGLIRGEDVQKPELARWLAGMAQTQGTAQAPDKAGGAAFGQLQEGLYLLTQSGICQAHGDFAPILVPVPCYGAWQVAVFPQVGRVLTEPPRTGQHPAPIIGAMGIVVCGILLGMCMDRLKRK